MNLVDSAGLSRRGIGIGVAAALILLGLTRASFAAVESVQPSSGAVVQGASTSATINLSASLGCVSAIPSDPTIVATVAGLPVSCGVGPRSVSMHVQTTGVTPVGSHQITIREVNSITSEIDLHGWSLEVLPLAPTTTTIATPSTTTTTTAAPTTTTSPPAPTSPTTAPSNSTTTTRAGATTTNANTSGSTTNPGVVVFPGGSTTSTTTTPTAATTPGEGLVIPVPGDSAEPDPMGDPRLWEEIRRVLVPVLSPRLVDVLLSPLIIIELVLAALLRSGRLILLPIAILGALVGWALRRWLPEIRALYSQRVQFSFLQAKGER